MVLIIWGALLYSHQRTLPREPYSPSNFAGLCLFMSFAAGLKSCNHTSRCLVFSAA
jgi:hypothetical protein